MKTFLFRLILMFFWTMSLVQAQTNKSVQRPLSGNPGLKTVSPTAVLSSNSTILTARQSLTHSATIVAGRGVTALPTQGIAPAAPLKNLQRAENGTIRWMEGRITGLHKTNSILAAATIVLNQNQVALLLQQPEQELRFMHQETDDLGMAHIRYAQMYRGIPVWGRDVWVHLQQEDAFIINGTYEPTPRTVIDAPTISKTQALSNAIRDLQATGRWQPPTTPWPGLPPDTASPVWVATGTNKMERAYAVRVQANFVESYTYLISAQDGRILSRTPHHCDLLGHKRHHNPLLDMPHAITLLPSGSDTDLPNPVNTAATFVNAQSKDLNGINRDLRVLAHTDGQFYMFWDLSNLSNDFAFNPASLWAKGGSVILDATNTDNIKFHIKSSAQHNWADASAVSAHYNGNITYQYYETKHNRKAINGADKTIWSVVNVTDGGRTMENAYWNGSFIAYGNGGSFFKPLAGSLDVAAHEMTHGVIQHSADLEYQGQSGALNESFADVFAMMIDRSNFLIGETVIRTGKGVALRDMANPANPGVLDPQPASMSQYNNTEEDNGGVHINSGIPNRAAYLIVNAIGHDKAEKIYYRALTKYLTRNSQFIDARNALEQSARDLYGEGAEAAAVKTAFDTVGIVSGSETTGKEDDVTVVSGGTPYIAFMDENGKIGLFEVNTQKAFLFNSEAAVARINTLDTGTDRSQLTAGRNGERIWFINTQNQLAFVTVSTGEVEVYKNLKLKSSSTGNDLWNVAIAPDESCVAIVSAYDNDPNLYFWCGNDVLPVELLPETTQSGILDQTIVYPDVVAWSPNMNEQRIAFDALHKNEQTTYWNTHEINFRTGRIYNLVPGYGTGLSVGNVTYSKTNPDLVAYNVIEPNEQDVVLTNLDTQEDVLAGFPSWTIKNQAIIDASRPTFSPDDQYIAATSEAHKALLFYERAARKVTQLSFSIPLYNLYWFVNGGNRLPIAAQITSPADNVNITLQGAPTTNLPISWTSGSDPDSDPLSYQWQISATSDFSRMLFTSPSQSGLSLNMKYADLNTLLKSISAGSNATLYHRVSTSDGVNTPIFSVPAKMNISRDITNSESETELPQYVHVSQVFPNPFRNQAALLIDLPQSAEVRITIYDALGRMIQQKAPAVMEAGKTQPIEIHADHWVDGVYFYVITLADGTGSKRFTGRMVRQR
ncbi:MAG: M4 family metallopeptidase [Bacteroidetes Order II. Incertae sedis bacterium]|nr:M4 family metallopeptidase [Bacteroidetes Order II. bacterium]